MATRKKTVIDPVNSLQEEALGAAAKPARTGKSATGSASTPKRTAAPKSSAAKHKAAARNTATTEAKPPAPAPAPAKPAFDAAVHHDEIAREAYHQWQRRGCPSGSPEHDWIAAIEIVRARYAR